MEIWSERTPDLTALAEFFPGGRLANRQRSPAEPTEAEEVESRAQAAEGPLYRVIIHNDNVTPMDFVIYVLRGIFLLAGVRAVQVMYSAHFHGEALVQTLPRAEAQRRVHQAHYTAAMARYPLKFTLEPE